MSTVVVRRPPRRPAPDIPGDELVVQPPPEIPQDTGGRWQQALQVLPMLVGSVAMALMMGGRNGGTYSYIMGGIFGVSALGMAVTTFTGTGMPKKAEMMAARREYLRHLASLRRQVRNNASRSEQALFYRILTRASCGPQQRASGSGNVAQVTAILVCGANRARTQTLATPLIPPVTRPLDELEPLTAGALRRFLDAYSVVPDLPVAVSLPGFSRLYLRSRGDEARGLARAILAQLAVCFTLRTTC